ncbi:MAG: sialate O-acetylesterase [Opitutales bacterium]
MRFLSTRLWSIALLSFTLFASLATSAEMRTWTSASDPSQTFEAKLLEYNTYNGMVTVDRGDRRLTFNQNVLSAQDVAYLKEEGNKIAEAARSGGSSSLAISGSIPDVLPDPDGKEANMRKPVQVFIIMGQSNTLEMGKVTDELKELYPYLADDSGAWTVRKDVRNVSVMQKGSNMDIYRNDWLTISGNKIGIEIGIGHYLGHAIDAPVMVLKSSIGNRSLGWDLLPPSVKTYEYEGQPQPGYREMFKSKTDKTVVKWEGEGWYAGKQYDDDVGNAKKILEELDQYYPGAKGYEVAGFLWWQGDKDMRNAAHYNNYEKHLVALIKDLRKDFDAPKAAFVTASLGQTDESDNSSGHGIILQAMKTVASGKYSRELGNNIGFVYTNPLSKGGSSGAHYNGNAETYMNVGEAMGKEMLELLGGK